MSWLFQKQNTALYDCIAIDTSNGPFVLPAPPTYLELFEYKETAFAMRNGAYVPKHTGYCPADSGTPSEDLMSSCLCRV